MASRPQKKRCKCRDVCLLVGEDGDLIGNSTFHKHQATESEHIRADEKAELNRQRANHRQREKYARDKAAGKENTGPDQPPSSRDLAVSIQQEKQLRGEALAAIRQFYVDNLLTICQCCCN